MVCANLLLPNRIPYPCVYLLIFFKIQKSDRFPFFAVTIGKRLEFCSGKFRAYRKLTKKMKLKLICMRALRTFLINYEINLKKYENVVAIDKCSVVED